MKMRIATVLASILAFGTLSATPAQADPGDPFEVWGLTGPGLHVNSGSCRNVTVNAMTNAALDYQTIDAEVDVWRGAEHLGSASLSRVGQSNRLRGTYYYCPWLDDVGLFRLGDSEVSWERYDDDFNYYESGSFVDTSRGSMVLKQSTRLALSGKRQRQLRKFRANGSYFGIEQWYRFPKGVRLSLQKQPSGAATWQWVKTAKTNRKGVAKFRVKTRAVYRYRVVMSATSRSWGATSRVLVR